jgi:hypothetical protein
VTHNIERLSTRKQDFMCNLPVKKTVITTSIGETHQWKRYKCPVLTARTRNGITSIMISVDFTPIALKNPTDPRTENMTSITPKRPSNT